MLAPTIIRTMYQYSHDTTNRLLDLATKVTPEQWDTPQEAGQRSLHQTLHHLIVVEEEYLHLCQTGHTIWASQPIERYPNATSLHALNDQIHATYLPYLERLTDDDLTTRITALMPSERVESVLIWHIFIHMLYHSAQHRSECAFMLTRYGHSPGFIDFYGYGNWGEV